ncbi:MAG: hypothetical protein JWO05_2752 [Gemmatimonadetes bacterium]|nr:hypothetical protein [Gemmatimonadota bacterium]
MRVVTEPLGGSPLARAAQAGTLDATIFAPHPRSGAEWGERVARVAASMPAHWREALAGAFGQPAPLARERLASAAVVVTTGQQPGLFGGPMYTFTKALAALSLANALERETGARVAPVFWAATDDADFDEAAITHVAVRGALRELRMHERPPAGTPMSRAPLGDVSAELRSLREASGSVAYEQALLEAERSYSAGATVGGAYLALLRALLEPLGICVLDASHSSVRSASREILGRALAAAAPIEAALRARTAELAEGGFDPQVEHVDGASLVFAYEAGGKRRLGVHESAPAEGEVVLGPNVLLRPVMERAILPTVAYVAGPGELAYFAQVSAVSRALGAGEPIAIPRWSCTVIEPHAQRALDRLGATPQDLDSTGALESRITRAAMPIEVASALESLRAATDSALRALELSDAQGLVPPAVHAGLRRSLEHKLARLERRYLAAVKRSEGQAMNDVAVARAALRPMGKPQERVLNFLPLLARQGPALLALMQERAAEWATSIVSDSR